jgi:catechol 2,3-dioxygenase-like lactoylglutathione lyase family enzyme
MLGGKEATASLGVRNIEVAKRFYEGTLGLKKLPGEEPGALVYKSGSSTILVYESQYAGTNRATAVTWDVGKDVDDVVKTLRAKGVTFEKYDIPGTTRQGDIHVQGKRRLAWFKDPDGNIHALMGK